MLALRRSAPCCSVSSDAQSDVPSPAQRRTLTLDTVQLRKKLAVTYIGVGSACIPGMAMHTCGRSMSRDSHASQMATRHQPVSRAQLPAPFLCAGRTLILPARFASSAMGQGLQRLRCCMRSCSMPASIHLPLMNGRHLTASAGCPQIHSTIPCCVEQRVAMLMIREAVHRGLQRPPQVLI